MNEREQIDRGWFYVIEPAQGSHAPEERRIRADDGRTLTRRLHGYPGRIEVQDPSDSASPATLLRAAAAVGAALEARKWTGEVLVVLGDTWAQTWSHEGRLQITMQRHDVATSPSHHPIEARVGALLTERPKVRSLVPDLPEAPAPRVMLFESLMNTDMPHNDNEISQGVLHMVSPMRGTGTEVVLVNAKMPIVGDARPVHGLDRLEAALAAGPVQLVCITLLEGYWEGVGKLIATLRGLGCRARIAVGGVMPSLAPEHVAAHLGDVSFICRGAGEYFVRRLARIVGSTTVDDPLTRGQRDALLHMEGMLVVDRAAGHRTLLAANCARTMSVDSLDRIDLDLQHLTHRHIEGGIEISTSRGCIHKCSFCSILGRESYQARSSGSIFDVLANYEERFKELHGDHIPPNSYRVHISDDDFACDRDRARTFFTDLIETPFRLSSVQVAVGDLCRREGGRLLAEPDHELLDAISPHCFHDHGRPIPRTDFYEDHKSRSWSSFLQIGVETYDDREIARLGKGYKRVHIRTIVAELAHRGLHMDGYFILSNADTTMRDLAAVFCEVSRLKLRYPEHFHMRFPVVKRLVSYFTAASHRRHVRRGRAHVMKLRSHAQVTDHPEFDYPFVDYDVSRDELVERTVQSDFVTDEGLYTANLQILRDMWSAWYQEDPTTHARLAPLLRDLDDRGRRLTFEMLHQATTGEELGWPNPRLDKAGAFEHAEWVLGPRQDWLPRFKTYSRLFEERRLTVVGDVDPRAIELLLATDAAQQTLVVRGGTSMEHAQVCIEQDPSVAATVRDFPDAAAVRLTLAAQDVSQLAQALRQHQALEQLTLIPTGRWSRTEAEALGAALFSCRAELAGVDLLGEDPWQHDPITQVVVDREHRIGRLDGLVDGVLQSTHVLGHLDDLTSIDRHQLDLTDPGILRGVQDVEQHLANRRAFDAVVASFTAWRRRTAAAPAQPMRDQPG